MTNPSYRLRHELVQNATRWNELVASLPQAHILQTWQWGQVKARLGWKMLPYIWCNEQDQVLAAALILQRVIPTSGFAARLSLLYIPRGPLLDWGDPVLCACVLDDIQELARRKSAIFIKIDPEVLLGKGIPGSDEAEDESLGATFVDNLKRRGWRFSKEQIQFRNTVIIDLTSTEEVMLARMKQKTRYNIHLAERKGIQIRPGTMADLPMLFKMYAETSIRDGFIIRDPSYYEYTWGTLLQNQMAEFLVAEFENWPVAGVVVYRFGGKAWYINGMSAALHREKMPNYLLQWEAMRRAKAAGCKVYDLWGAPNNFVETDTMWGVFRFKEGLGGTVLRTPGAWDYTTHPWLYRLYSQTLPHLLEIMRRKGKAETYKEIG